MIGSYLVGKEDYRSEYPKWFDVLIAILCIIIVPILYLFDLMKELLIKLRQYFDLWTWWKYLTDKNFGKDLKYDTIEFIKNSKPKHKLEKLLRKKLLKRYENN